MFDQALGQINNILGITVGGVSLASLLGLLITFFVEIRKLHNQNKLTKEFVEQAFQKAVLPKTVKLDLSSKIEEPLKDGFTEMRRLLQDTLEKVERGEQLILSVLHEFSHIHKLPENVQAEIEDYIESNTSVTVKLED